MKKTMSVMLNEHSDAMLALELLDRMIDDLERIGGYVKEPQQKSVHALIDRTRKLRNLQYERASTAADVIFAICPSEVGKT